LPDEAVVDLLTYPPWKLVIGNLLVIGNWRLEIHFALDGLAGKSAAAIVA